MIGHRARYSLAQFLELQTPQFVVVLLGKYGAQVSLYHDQQLIGILNALRALDGPSVMQVLSEIIVTKGDLRARVNPKYRFDQRLYDLTQCLTLDGYAIMDERLVQTDPSISGAPPVDDDLIQLLQSSWPPRAAEIIQKVNDSAEAFRRPSPDYNAALTNARVALETLAADVASGLSSPKPASFDPTKWGKVIEYLRLSGEITVEEEHGLSGVYRFLSPGAHRPVGIPEEQMTRLGRSLALNMCWFLLQNYLARRSQQR